MARSIYRKIITLILEAAHLGRSVGIANLLQPGLVKEMIIADTLGHELIHSKRDADAHAANDPDAKYEYLSCVGGGSGQLDRMFSAPPEKRARSLRRITRNKSVFLAAFHKEDQLRCESIYEIDPNVMLLEAERQLDRSRNEISHVAFPESWAKEHGRLVYADHTDQPMDDVDA